MKRRQLTSLFLKGRVLNWVLFGISLALFFSLNRWTVFAYDDFNYHFIYGKEGLTNVHLNSLTDVFTSQYHHYFLQNGRFLVHTLLQILCISDNKIWFDCVNTIVFGLFQIILLKSIQLSISTIKPLFYLLFLLLLWFLLPGPNYCFLWLSGSFNYYWASTAAIFLLHIYRRKNTLQKHSKTQIIGLVLISFLLNATNEVISIAITVALLFDVIRHRKYSLRETSIAAGATLATILMVIAPGNFIRLAIIQNKSTSSISRLIVADDHHPWIAFIAVKVFIILGLILILLCFVKWDYCWKKIKEYHLFLIGIVASLAFVYWVQAFSQRAVFPASVLAFVILIAILKDFVHQFSFKIILSILILLSAFAVHEYVNAAIDLRANQQQFAAQLETIKNSNPRQTIFEEITYRKNRFVCTGLGVSDSKNISNMGISRMLNRRSLLFLSKPLVNRLQQVSKDTIYYFKNVSKLIVSIPEKNSGEFKATLELQLNNSIETEIIDGEYATNHNGEKFLIIPVSRDFCFKNLSAVSIQSVEFRHKLVYNIKNR